MQIVGVHIVNVRSSTFYLEAVSYPCVLRTCIDISLDLGRVENKQIEALVAESIYCNNDTVRLPRSLPATLTIVSQESTLALT